MIRHTVLFGWNEHARDEDKKRAFDELATLPAIVPSVRGFALGFDQRVNEGNYDFAVTADFDNINGYFAYRDDPAHRAIVAAYVAPDHGPPGRRPVRIHRLAVLARGATPRNPPLRFAPRRGTSPLTGRSPGTRPDSLGRYERLAVTRFCVSEN